MLSKLVLSSVLVSSIFATDRVVHSFSIDSIEDNKSISIFKKIKDGRLFRASSLYRGDNALFAIKIGIVKYMIVDSNFSVPKQFGSLIVDDLKIVGTPQNISLLKDKL